MSLLSLNHVSLNLANNTILNQVNWQIHAKERIALVGRNGAGKSTLLKLLQGQITPDKGTIQKQNNLRIASLMQDVPVSLNETVYHFLVKQLGSLGEVLTQYYEATLDNNTTKMAACQEQIDAENAWDILPQIDAMANHLTLPLNSPINSLSGGMRRRALLGAALLAKADLLLLDEPTNHLDIHTIEWLETYLKNYPGTLLVVTHDRAFLTRISTSIVEIDRGNLHTYACDYNTYLDRQEAMRASEQTQNKLFDKRLKEEEVWLRQGIKARRTRNEGRVRSLEAMRETRRARREQAGRAKSLALDVTSSGKLVIEAEQLNYQLKQQLLIRDFSCRFMRGDKIGIIGPNGCGKTTLIRLLLNDLAPTSGKVHLGTNLNIAYFDQLRRELDEKQTVMENVADGADFVTINGQSKHVASYLRDFLFSPDRFNQPVFSLSGGERNRLLLAKLFAKPVNLLIMDEPTNDLDIETLELLESMLADYPGTLLLISHDRAFLNHIVTSILVFEGEGHIYEHVGGYDDYYRYKKETLEFKKDKPPLQTKTNHKPNLNSSEQRELKQLPKKIETLEKQIETMHIEMASPDFYQREADAITQLTNKLETLEATLSEAYARWERLENNT
ncbi:MAG: ATP-binding cassette domain-containing protein [Gammaproteobacteria bacterium]|nr:ATP-binding cassette domain-containing protein [Gammaproteobacteria bacterium]